MKNFLNLLVIGNKNVNAKGEKLQENDSVLVEFNGEEIRKIGFHDGDYRNNGPSGMFNPKASAEEVKQKMKMQKPTVQSIRKNNYGRWVEANYSSKKASGEEVSYQEQKSDRCSNGSQSCWTRTGKRKAEVTDAENLINDIGCPSSECRKWRQGGSSL